MPSHAKTIAAKHNHGTIHKYLNKKGYTITQQVEYNDAPEEVRGRLVLPVDDIAYHFRLHHLLVSLSQEILHHLRQLVAVYFNTI